MPKFRKKPLIVDAFQFTRESIMFDGPGEKLPDWIQKNSKIALPKDKDAKTEALLVHTSLDDDPIALQGDYIIKNCKGELSVLPALLFEQIWEPVKNDGPCTCSKVAYRDCKHPDKKHCVLSEQHQGYRRGFTDAG